MNYFFSIPMRPVALARARFSSRTRRFFTPKKSSDAKRNILLSVQYQLKTKYPFFKLEKDQALKLVCIFYFKRPKSKKNETYHIVRPDASNLLKLVEDSLNGLLWHDDCQISEVTAIKKYDENERIDFFLECIKNDE